MATDGAKPPERPFRVSWEHLQHAFSEHVMRDLKVKCPSLEYHYDGKKKRGVKVHGTVYIWLDIAGLWNAYMLHEEWGMPLYTLHGVLSDGR